MAHAQTARIEFAATPLESGIRLDRNGLAPSSVEHNGQKTSTWVSRHGSVPSDEWARSFGLILTDERLRNGRAPVVDVEIQYWHNANTAVEVVADTRGGSRKVASAWGGKNELQTLKFRLEDAFFGARNHGNDPKTLPSDGYDLRVKAWAGDFHLASVKIVAHSRENPTDWAPFLSFGEAKSARGWVLEPGQNDTFSFEIQNSALRAASVLARWEILDLGGRIVAQQSQNVSLAPEKSTRIAYDFAAQTLPAEEYSARLSLFIEGEKTPIFARERSLMIAEKDDVFILFDREPIARGMDWNREGMSAQEIEVGGVKRWIWRGDAIFGAQPWWRSAKFNVTDARFTGGLRPVTDVRFTYRHAPNSPIWIGAQGENGPRILAQEWGNNSGWSSSFSRFDDAKWGARVVSDDPQKLLPDGADLRISANSGAVEIRSIRVRGYDLDNPNWNRLIRYDGLDANRARYIFAPGERAPIKIQLFNLSNKPFDASAHLALRDDLGGPIWKREQNAILAPRKLGNVPFEFDTTPLKRGVHLLNLEMGLRGAREKLVKQEINLLVSPLEPLPRAKPGEFLYGMDFGGSWHDDWLLEWTSFIGADFLRTSNASPQEMPQALEKLRKLGFQTAHMAVPVWHENPEERRRRNAEIAQNAALVARNHPEILWYELGNEPDLTFFYPGSPAQYIEDFVQIRDAIKAANPKALVMNGGLCFAGEEGDRRAREIIRLMPLEKIDAWAYHAHGPGAQSERKMLELMRSETRKWGKDGIAFIDTESGVAAGTLVQQRMQARTAIQKMVYAQGEGMPAFLWFRTYISGGDGGYTNVKNAQEARPVMASFRTLVEQLRGYRFARHVDLGSSDYEGYLFVQNGPHGEQNQTRAGRVLVAWANARGGARRLLSLGKSANLQTVDLFGNAQNGEKSASVAGLTVDSDPIFLRWQSDEKPEAVRVLPSLLEVAPTIFLAPKSRETVDVSLRNPSGAPLQTELRASAPPESNIETGAPIPVSLGPGETQTVKVPISVGAPREKLEWPRRWSVFAPLPTGKFDLQTPDEKTAREIPGKIEVEGQSVVAKSVIASEGRIDIAPLGGGFGERKEAILMASLDSPRAQTVQIGASADWYMEWFINGARVYSTLDGGNAGPQSLLSHVFSAPLQAGKNRIAVRVQSGSQGWNFLSGGPQELGEAQGNAAQAPNRLTFSLGNAAQTQPLALETARIEYARAIGPDFGVEPHAILGDLGVQNPFSIEPDSSRWWQGAADLSGEIRFRATAQNLEIEAKIRDDIEKSGDALRLAFAANEKSLDLKIENGELWRLAGENWQKIGEVRSARDAQNGVTTHRISVARALLPDARFAFNAVAVDDDWGARKQWAPLADGFGDGLNLTLENRQTADWPRFVLAP